MIRFTLPGLPPSTNNAYINVKRGRVLSPAGRKWIEAAGLHMLGQLHGQEKIPAGAELALQLRLYGRWNTQRKQAKHKWRKVDLSNRIKLLEDVAAKVCRFDDSQVTLLRAEKVESDTSRTELDIFPRWEMP